MASAIVRALALLRAPGNSLRFALRQRRAGGGVAQVVNEGKDQLFGHLAAGERQAAARRERELCDRYELARLRGTSSQLHYAENVALLDLLERSAVPLAGKVGRVFHAVDVGSGPFQYATALQRFLARAGGGWVALTGVEIDGHGRYPDGSTRAAHGRAHASLAGAGVEYQVDDFTRMSLPTQDFVSMLFPFLTAYPLLRWGLPLRVLQPRRLLERAAERLRPGGVLLVVNQTGAEFTRLQMLLNGLPLRLECSSSWRTTLVPYAERTEDRVGSWWRRT
ncbi:MAG: class I SAM-dependent methyltransferase [Planctomycetes bacterium]|nr:class I SAM-dependent methyltransferase [Planctomycetota bacterium]